MWVSAHVAFKAFSGILTKEKVDQLAKKKYHHGVDQQQDPKRSGNTPKPCLTLFPIFNPGGTVQTLKGS